MTATSRHTGWGGSPWRLLLWAVPTALLATPAVMMARAVEGWLWSPSDFVFAAVLLFGTTGLIDLAIRKGGSTAYRLGAALAVLVSFLLVWVNGAVGVIGNEDNPANLMFIGIIFIALAGSALARFEARGMARATLAAFALTVMIAAAIPTFGWGADEPPGTPGLTMLIAGFALLWGLSSALFTKAADDASRA
ncbi:MAG TPA: hypothetical protein VI168_17095 [Croceibacterium sp.]